MIKIPAEILTVAELMEASNKSEQDIDIEITNISVKESGMKSGLVITVDTKLNFVMPKRIENVMKERIIARIGSAKRVSFNYAYTGIKIPDNADYEQNGSSGYSGNGRPYRKRDADKPSFTNPAGELVVLGSDFSGKTTDYSEIETFVGSSDKAVIEGEIFKMDSIPIKSGRMLVSIFVANKARTLCLKSFVSQNKMNEIDENLGEGDMIMARGSIEYDTYEHADHGVVQAFPDAAAEAARQAGRGREIKVIYGLEGYLYPD